MIKLENVNKYFYRHKKNEVHVINNVSLELPSTGLVALLGPSGCGKTTLLNSISGLDKINNGKIYVNGKRISKKCSSKVDKIRNLNIGYIFQDYNLIDNMSVFDNVSLSLRINGIKNKNIIKQRVNYVLEKVNMYRYRNRYASMLSGGERQRVGIARAIIKEPNIIIADEPTGNLDSKNTLEVMNIIKAISKSRLVILVTHEKSLAEFYASRIIEIEDGKIISDKNNEHNNDLDYKLDNKIYLKDFKNQEIISNKDIKINYYSDTNDKLNINLIVQNGNIYINSNDDKKLKLIEDNCIEIVDDHYKKISKSIYEEYKFDFDSLSDKKIKMKYSSIINPFSMISKGFKKILDYSFTKKLLLIGFFLSSMFIIFALSSLLGINNIDERKYIKHYPEYLIVEDPGITVDKFLKYENDEDIEYVIPGESKVSLILNYNDYYQTYQTNGNINGSLTSITKISEDDIIEGRMPNNSREIVIDKMATKVLFSDYSSAKYSGIFDYPDLINRKVKVNNNIDYIEYTIVGVVDKVSPAIYAYDSEFITLISNSNDYDDGEGYFFYTEEYADEFNDSIVNYELVKDKIKLKKGKYPKNDYEVIVNYNYKDQYKLNKKIDVKVNDKKLKVVGYYTSTSGMNSYLVNENTIKYKTLLEKQFITILAKDKEKVLSKYTGNASIRDISSYERSEYIKERKEDTRGTLIFSTVILTISLIEIYFMMRSSFLSRIKEVGIYRAIGVKKKDIYMMFAGEIIAISTLTGITGSSLMGYIIHELSFMESISDKFIINIYVYLLSLVFIYLFNLIVGLLPVALTIRKTPAQILSRTDI